MTYGLNAPSCDPFTVNIEKTNIIVFRHGGCLKRNEKWYHLGEQIDTVNTFKYL